jgi:large subunit ribosomal protein L9
MKLILKQDVNNVGHKDDVVTVKAGYGRNFLIPQGYATTATESALKVHAETMKQRAHKEEKIRGEATAMAKKLDGLTVKVAAKTSTTGKIFGSVSNIQVAEAVSALGFEVERKNITIKHESIKEVGTYQAKVKLYKDIAVEISFEVYSE